MNNIKSFVYNNRHWIILFLLFFIFEYLFFPDFWGDDAQNHDLVGYQNPLIYAIQRYQTWSSRFFIEGMLIWFTNVHIVFYITFISFINVLFVKTITSLLGKNTAIFCGSILVCLLFTVFDYYINAGVIASVLNYFVPFTLGVYGLANAWNIYQNREGIKITAFIALAVAGCSELVLAFSGSLIAAMIFFYLLRERKINLKLLVLMLPLIINLISFALCPGNEIRTVNEIEQVNNLFGDPYSQDLALRQKINIGLVYSTDYDKTSIAYNIMLVGLLVFGIIKRKWTTLLVIPAVFLNNFLAENNQLLSSYHLYEAYYNFDAIAKYNFILYALIAILMLFIFKNKFISLTFMAALLGKVLMGFSPTYYLSGERTSTILISVILLITLYTINKIFENLKGDETYEKN